VSELAEPLAMSFPAIVPHLDVLQMGGLVRLQRHGRVAHLPFRAGPMRAVE